MLNPGIVSSCKVYNFIISVVIIGTLCIIGTVGNIIAFFVFIKDNIKTSTSFLFQSLSLIDTILLVTAFPIYSVKTFVDFTQLQLGFDIVYPYIMVYILPWAFVAQTATIWVTVLVCVNRFIAVCKPYQASRLCTVVQAKRQLSAVILFAIIYNIPRFLAAKVARDTDSATNKTIVYPSATEFGENKYYNTIYVSIFYFLFLIFIPLMILTLLNIKLVTALKEIKRKRAELVSARQQQDNNVTFVLIIVVLVFIICQSPALVNQILWNVLPDKARKCGYFQFYLSKLSNALVILNSSVNFLIYFLFNTRFRQVLVECFCKGQFKPKRISTTNHVKEVKETEGTRESLL